MIFERLRLHNFGIYRGQHAVDLSPKSKSKPIILLGGLNGGGKTTFLDALQLTLYGKFAKTSNRGSLSYDDYLLETINHHVSPKEGASLELTFKYFSEGEAETYHIKRQWRSTGKAVKENVKVLRNGLYDPIMSEQWYEYVDEFMPRNVAGLFFFDGEKIETLAEPENASAILRTGIYSLLGLDLVDKLSTDLLTIERRKKLEQQHVSENADLTKLDQTIISLRTDIEATATSLASKRSELDVLNLRLKNIQDKYRFEGGELYEQSHRLEHERTQFHHKVLEIEDQLRKLAEGVAPLFLVKNLFSATLEQAKQEHEITRSKIAIEELRKRDKTLLKELKNKADKSILKTIQNTLERDIKERQKSIKEESYLNIEPSNFEGFNNTTQKSLKQTICETLDAHKQLNSQLENVERKLSSIPKPESIEETITKIRILEKQINILSAEINLLSDKQAKSQQLLESTQLKYGRQLDQLVEAQYKSEHEKRILEQAGAAHKTIATFKEKLIERNLRKLQELILGSFISLIRKQDLISKLSIHPVDFTLTLHDFKNRELPAKRLSAGERQLLAISILWGLSKASGRPLPAIIDTPLGRLDSQHRSHLIENYFPKASHQVILLSTDEEIDQQYRDELAPRIGREYRIQYLPNEQTSTITPGYF